jgi:hypothetical protein
LPSATETTTTLRGGRRGSLVSPSMKTRRPICRGAATSLARRSTGVTCRGRPRRRLPATPKCRRHDSRRRPRTTRLGFKLASSSSPCPRGPVDCTAWCGTQRDGRLRVTEIRTLPSQPPEKIRGATDVCPLALRWL